MKILNLYAQVSTITCKGTAGLIYTTVHQPSRRAPTPQLFGLLPNLFF
jgi:hypothetical protein